jgi:hypothetical protein
MPPITQNALHERTKVSARAIGTFVREYLDESGAKHHGLSGQQQAACSEAASWLTAMVVPDRVIDLEQAVHFASQFVGHYAKSHDITPMDYVVFATYLNTAQVQNSSGYTKEFLP